MLGFQSLASPLMTLTLEASDLIWIEWDDAYIVYQPSSTETHVFNETTATILRCLERGSATMEGLADCIFRSLGIEQDELSREDLAFATGRLETLGLIEWTDEATPSP